MTFRSHMAGKATLVLQGAISHNDQDSFPILEHVEEDFEVYLCAQLQSLHVPQLLRIDEDLLLFGNPRLTTVELPLLEDVAVREGGGMLITDNLGLGQLVLPSLKRVGNSTARIQSWEKLFQLSFIPQLSSINYPLNVALDFLRGPSSKI